MKNKKLPGRPPLYAGKKMEKKFTVWMTAELFEKVNEAGGAKFLRSVAEKALGVEP